MPKPVPPPNNPSQRFFRGYSCIEIFKKSLCTFWCKKSDKEWTRDTQFRFEQEVLYKALDVTRILNEIKQLREIGTKIMVG